MVLNSGLPRWLISDGGAMYQPFDGRPYDCDCDMENMAGLRELGWGRDGCMWAGDGWGDPSPPFPSSVADDDIFSEGFPVPVVV